MENKWVYMFSEGNMSRRNLHGGKGANLAEMTNIGLPVPQGFTITTEACTQYYEDGKHFHSCSSHSYIIIVIKKHIIVKSNRRKKEKYLKNPSAFFRIFGTLFLFHIQYQMTWQTIYHNRLIITLN